MAAPTKGQVCVVTGASRVLGAASPCSSAKQVPQFTPLADIWTRCRLLLRILSPGAIPRVRCVPVVCDSSQESDVRSLFEQVNQEQHRRLDVLVSNAYAGVQTILDNLKKTFWESPASIWDDINK